MEILRVHTRRSSGAAIAQAAAALRAGKLVIFPTETLYGLGADALNTNAVQAIFTVKRRPAHKPIIVLIASYAQLALLAASVSPTARALMRAFWPGPLTIVFPAKKSLPRALTSGTGTVAVRLTAHPIARALIHAAGTPLTATSANVSGQSDHQTLGPILKRLAGARRIAVALDAGITPSHIPSTVIDATKNPPVIVREGVISKKTIARVTPLS